MRIFLAYSLSKPVRSNAYVVFLLIGTLFLMSCGGTADSPTEDIIVKYRQNELSRGEINHFLPPDLTPQDSLFYANQYINEWIRSQAIAEQAYSRITNLNEVLRYKLKRYEQQLIEHEYATWMVRQNQRKLDVSDEEILDYYNRHPNKFKSRGRYHQYFFIRTESGANQTVIPLMRSNAPEKIFELEKWAQENAIEYRLDSSYVQDAELERVSEGFYYGNIRRASKATPYPYSCVIEGKTYYNYFRLIDIVQPDDQLPLRLCRNQISDILYNQKKNDLINEAQQALLQQAKETKSYIRYDEE